MPDMSWNLHPYRTKYSLFYFVGIALILTGCSGGGGSTGSSGNSGSSGGSGNSSTPSTVKQSGLSVSTTNVSMAVGGNASLNAIMTYVDGTTADFTSQATWTSASPGVVSVGANSGVLTGVSAGGPVAVTATLNGLTLTSSVMVSTVGVGSGSVMATGRYDHTASLLGSGSSAQVLVTGGYDINSSALSSAEVYDTISGTWSSSTPINVPRGDHTTVTLKDGRVLITGGMDTNATNNIVTTELYDPVIAAWTVTGPLNDGRSYNAITLLATTGQVLVAGGDDNSGVVNTAEIYTPVASSNAGTWVAINPMIEARDNFTATFLPASVTHSQGAVLVVGGFNSSTTNALSSCEIYDVATGTWSAAAPIPGGRGDHTATLLTAGTYAGQVLVVGGMGSSPSVFLNTVERYDPAHDTWIPVATLSIARYWHNAVLLPADTSHPSGQVLVMGGVGNVSASPTLTSNELYDPVTNLWTTTPYSFTTGRSTFTSTLIAPCASYSNGCVLSTGGYGNFSISNALNSSELYSW
jgi:hypothetical protein